MKNEFVVAINQLSAEKNLDSDTVFEAVEAAMASAFKKDELQYADVVAKIDHASGEIRTWRRYEVIDDDDIEDDEIQVSPERAATMGHPDAKIGEFVLEEVETTPSTGRIAAQTAKQVVLQRLREAERESVYEDFTGKEGELVSGTVLRVEAGRRQVVIDLGRTEAVLPFAEQVRAEHYRVGQRLRVFVKEVYRAAKGPQVVVSRSNPMLLRRLLELEVPEIARGSVEIVGVSRDPGYRSKVALISRQKGVDPIGAAVGVRGVRIQNIVNELGGERIDLIRWDPNELAFIANALSPAEVVSIRFSEEDQTVYIAVPERQVSLAIGKEGQNARLAAKLTGRRIDIRSENTLMAAGEDLYPPPEPNMEAIPLAEPAALPTLPDAPPDPDRIAPSQAEYARPGLPGELAAVAPEEPEAETRLTPEQEVLAELAKEEQPAAEVEVEVEAAVEPVAPTPQRRAPEAPGGIRFAEELVIRRDDEEEQGDDGGRQRRQQRRRGGAPVRASERTPARPERQSRRVDLQDFDEDEIEAALHGEEPEFGDDEGMFGESDEDKDEEYENE